jgi:hypothetical protein
MWFCVKNNLVADGDGLEGGRDAGSVELSEPTGVESRG